jgi:hypothetical protein
MLDIWVVSDGGAETANYVPAYFGPAIGDEIINNTKVFKGVFLVVGILYRFFRFSSSVSLVSALHQF